LTLFLPVIQVRLLFYTKPYNIVVSRTERDLCRFMKCKWLVYNIIGIPLGTTIELRSLWVWWKLSLMPSDKSFFCEMYYS